MIKADIIDIISAVNLGLLFNNIETILGLILLIVQIAIIIYKLIYSIINAKKKEDVDEALEDFRAEADNIKDEYYRDIEDNRRL